MTCTRSLGTHRHRPAPSYSDPLLPTVPKSCGCPSTLFIFTTATHPSVVDCSRSIPICPVLDEGYLPVSGMPFLWIVTCLFGGDYADTCLKFWAHRFLQIVPILRDRAFFHRCIHFLAFLPCIHATSLSHLTYPKLVEDPYSSPLPKFHARLLRKSLGVDKFLLRLEDGGRLRSRFVSSLLFSFLAYKPIKVHSC